MNTDFLIKRGVMPPVTESQDARSGASLGAMWGLILSLPLFLLIGWALWTHWHEVMAVFVQIGDAL